MSRHDLSNPLVISQTDSLVVVSRRCRLLVSDLLVQFFVFGQGPLGRGGLFARFVRQTQVGKSAGHQLVTPADLPTKVISWLKPPTDYLFVVKSSRPIDVINTLEALVTGQLLCVLFASPAYKVTETIVKL